MENKEKDVVIEAKDFYRDCISDGVDRPKRSIDTRPSGYVEIFEVDETGHKRLVSKQNLVVYLGREWLISRAFNLDNTSILPAANQFVGWFGIGDGGCYSYDPLDPIPPTNLDLDLNNKIPFNSTDATYGEYLDSTSTSDIGYYKKKIDIIEYLQDIDNSDKYLIGRTTNIIGIDDGNGRTVSEAALYVAESLADGLAGPFHMYAKITFPTLVKSSTRHIVLIWYLFY